MYIKNDNIFDVENKYNLLPQKIINYNGLVDPINIPIGTKLYLPYPQVHKVQSGDNIFDLSVRYKLINQICRVK